MKCFPPYYIKKEYYLSPAAWADEMYLLQAQIPKAIYSHETALYLHDLAEMEPTPLTVTVSSQYNSPALAEKRCKDRLCKKGMARAGRLFRALAGGTFA